jgi:hypothetical protein
MSRIYRETPLDMESVIEEVPDKIIATNLQGWKGATELHVYYHNGNTYVETSGELYNADGMFTEGIITPEEVLADYLAELSQES